MRSVFYFIFKLLKINFLLLLLFTSIGYYDSCQILLINTSSLCLNLQRMPSVMHRSMSDAPTVKNGNPGKADTPTGNGIL